jgi:DNA modification methylase
MRGNKIVKADFGDWDKWDNQDDYLNFVFQVCNEYQRILKPNASMVLFFSYRTS